MPNQYTKENGGTIAEAQPKTKFTVNLTADQREALVWLSNHFEKDGSAIFRYCITFLSERLTEFKRQYPNLPTYSLPAVLQSYYDAGKKRMEDERAKENELMARYQQAKRGDGGKINYDMDRLALAFHVRAWHSGKSGAEVLEDFAKQKAELGKRYGIDWHDDPWLRNFMQSGTADQGPNQAAHQGPNQSNQTDPEALTDLERWFLVALAALVVLALGLAGSWAWFLTR